MIHKTKGSQNVHHYFSNFTFIDQDSTSIHEELIVWY